MSKTRDALAAHTYKMDEALGAIAIPLLQKLIDSNTTHNDIKEALSKLAKVGKVNELMHEMAKDTEKYTTKDLLNFAKQDMSDSLKTVGIIENSKDVEGSLDDQITQAILEIIEELKKG
jgi:hypothetical protein